MADQSPRAIDAKNRRHQLNRFGGVYLIRLRRYPQCCGQLDGRLSGRFAPLVDRSRERLRILRDELLLLDLTSDGRHFVTIMPAILRFTAVTECLMLTFICLSGIHGIAMGQEDTSPYSSCMERFSENGVDVFVSASSYDPMSQLESGGALLTDPFAPRTATAYTSMSFPVAEERFGVGGIANSETREVTLSLTSDGQRHPTRVTVFFRDIEAATAEALKARNLECRLALDGEIVLEVQPLKIELSQYNQEWSASCGTEDPDNRLGMVDIGIVDAGTGEPIYRARFGTHVPPETMKRIGDAIRNTSANAISGLCDRN